MPGLGRIPSAVPMGQWRAHAMEEHVLPLSDEFLATLQPRMWATGSVLDQDAVGSDPIHPYCVGFAGSDHLRGEPHRHPDLDPGGLELYVEAQQHDGYTLPHEGSSIHGLLEALAERGLASRDNAVWATAEWTVRAFVLQHGPVLMGTAWYNSMFTPDAEGIVHVNAYDADNFVAGGHAWSIIGYDWHCFNKLPQTEHGLYLCMNHWGNEWGVPRPDAPNGEAGYFLISHDDLTFLMTDEQAAPEALAVANWSGA